MNECQVQLDENANKCKRREVKSPEAASIKKEEI
jgi:hypothetical protein